MMLHNRFAGDALKKVDRFYEAGIEMNGQIVLCKGVNDGAELERSISDMSKYLPHLRSVSVVPVGLSKYREGLYPLEPFTKEEAQQVLATIHKWQEKLFPEYGLHFIHASDEWYILAEEEIPDEDNYDGYHSAPAAPSFNGSRQAFAGHDLVAFFQPFHNHHVGVITLANLHLAFAGFTSA